MAISTRSYFSTFATLRSRNRKLQSFPFEILDCTEPLWYLDEAKMYEGIT